MKNELLKNTKELLEKNKQLTDNTILLLEKIELLETENKDLKKENLELKNKILLLEKIKSTKKVTRKLKGPGLKENFELLNKLVLNKSDLRPILNCINVTTDQLQGKNNNDVLLINDTENMEPGLYHDKYNKNHDLIKVKDTIMSRKKVYTVDRDDYPILTKKYKNDYNKITINKEFFINAIDNVIAAAATNKDNDAINGIRIELINNELVIVATDTYRLIHHTIKEHQGELKKGITIKLDTIKAVKTDIKKYAKNIEIYTNDGDEIILNWSNRELYTKISSYPYPNFKSIIDNIGINSYDSNIEILEKIDFKTLIDISKNNNESKHVCLFDFNNNDILKLKVGNDIQEYTQEIKINNNTRYEAKMVSLNIKFIEDAFKSLNIEKNVKINIYNASSAISLKNDDTMIIIMPLALRD
jgi:DNA polymerase III sliding clamp (beta) subunit (PCNA family)